MVASNRVTARLWLISHIGATRISKASVLAVATLLLSSQLALAQFTQQGPKLVGTLAVGAAEQGSAVALSAAGNTAIVGGFADNATLRAISRVRKIRMRLGAGFSFAEPFPEKPPRMHWRTYLRMRAAAAM
jgi:hypothetical protein